MVIHDNTVLEGKRTHFGGKTSPHPRLDAPDVSVQEEHARAPRPIGLPTLLAGGYGGLFKLVECATSIGCIYSVGCVADGTSIQDYSDM